MHADEGQSFHTVLTDAAQFGDAGLHGQLPSSVYKRKLPGEVEVFRR